MMKLNGIIAVLALGLSLVGCSTGAPNARRKVREVHVPEVQRMLRDDIEKHLRGAEKGAHKIAPGFSADPAVRESQMRTALKLIHLPPRGVSELMTSPLTFVAAVQQNGVALCRDGEPDALKGQNLAEQYPVVRDALAGRTGYAVIDMAGMISGTSSSHLVFAAPARVGEQVVGALVVGIPLWRLEQRITRQLQLDHVGERGLIVWSYVTRGGVLHNQAAEHPDLDLIVPNAEERRLGLQRSPGGFTAEREQYGRWYAFGIVPTPALGPDTGFIVVRSDPL